MAALLRPACASGPSLCVLLADGWWKSSPAPNVTKLLSVPCCHQSAVTIPIQTTKLCSGSAPIPKRKPFSVNYFITPSTVDFLLLTAPWLDNSSRAADTSAFDAFPGLIRWTLLQMEQSCSFISKWPDKNFHHLLLCLKLSFARMWLTKPFVLTLRLDELQASMCDSTHLWEPWRIKQQNKGTKLRLGNHPSAGRWSVLDEHMNKHSSGRASQGPDETQK